MALSPFSLNPTTPSPSSSSPCKYSASHSLYFLLRTSNPLRVSCSQRLVQFETDRELLQNQQQLQLRRVKAALEIDNPTKKKRKKPRPSFLEQIQQKWSTKLVSRRDKFPWQEEQGKDEEEEEAESMTELGSGIGEKASSVSESESFGLTSTVISAPWTHGEAKTIEPLVDHEPEAKENLDRDFHRKFGAHVGSDNLKPSYRFHEEFVMESDDDDDEEEEEEQEETSVSRNTRTENEKDGDLANSITTSLSLQEKKEIRDREFHRKFDARVGNDNPKPGYRFHEDLDTESDDEEEEQEQEKTPLTRNTTNTSFSLHRIENCNEKDGDLGDHSPENSTGSESGGVERFKWKRSNTATAEKTLPEHELKRLRNVSLRMPGRIKVGARGITQELVGHIREKWELDEVVKLKFEEPLSLNMRRTHGILENKTGGLVIWRAGSLVVLYRGMSYNLQCVQSYTNQIPEDTTEQIEEVVRIDYLNNNQAKDSIPNSAKRVKGQTEGEVKSDYLNDLNALLDSLGPRFIDWLGREPLPVDGDLLPAIIPNYKPPFRLLPYGMKGCVGNKQMTKLRGLARTMLPHFALGRNRELQGLAKAMVKLWEKSAIAKIAIKRGVQNTCNERMAEELKILTGGTLLSRNKDFIVFYRGNDFLPPSVTEALKERRKLRDLQQDHEEHVRQLAPSFFTESKQEALDVQFVAGTLAETRAASARWGRKPSSEDAEKMAKDSSLARRKSIIKHLERKLIIAKGNLGKAEKALAKVQRDLNPSDLPDDLETITEEERFLFRKMGLKMRPFLLIGTRGMYDGTIENMHLHWKYRELVKIIMKVKRFEQVKYVATSLEAESGGILVSIDKLLKEYAIIVYRGKNYEAPDKIRPKNLLTKRQALAQSTELQRRQALRHHIWDLQERIGLLKSELEESESIENEGTSQSTVKDSDNKGTSRLEVEDSPWSDDDQFTDVMKRRISM